jgi:hypothetical protein
MRISCLLLFLLLPLHFGCGTTDDQDGPADSGTGLIRDGGGNQSDGGICELPAPQEPDCTPAGSGLGAGTAIDYTEFNPRDPSSPVVLPDGCQVEAFGSRAFHSAQELNAALLCSNPTSTATISGVDFAQQTVVIVSDGNTNSAAILWVVNDGTENHVGVRRDAYCGGAAPEGVLIFLLVESADTVASSPKGCFAGDPMSCCACDVVCDPEPRRTNCSCPP